jgi:hypothetical protein
MYQTKSQCQFGARFAVQVGIGLSIILSAAGPAAAQPIKAAVVKNVDEPGRVPHSVNFNCSAQNVVNCISPGPAIPTGKRFVVQFVSAYFETPNPGLGYMTIIKSTGLLAALPATSGGLLNGLTRYTISQSITGFIDAGQTWEVNLYFGANASASLVITGYLVDLSI